MANAPIERPVHPVVLLCLCFIASTALPVRAQSGSRNPFGGGGMNFPQQEEEKRPKRLPYIGPKSQVPLVDVRIVGNRTVTEQRIRSMLKTKAGRNYDPELVRRDMRVLMQSGSFTAKSRTYKKQVDGGIIITFELFERPLTGYVRFVGNEKLKDKKLLEATGMHPGDPLNHFSVEEGRRKIEQLYREKGYYEAWVKVVEGTKPNDRGVVYQINEGQVIRVYKTTFAGNSIVSDARLKTVVESKPGILWLLGGKANVEEVKQDVQRLTSYYRSLGYFRAEVSQSLDYNKDRKWVTVNFVIDEGPRYRVHDVILEGSEHVHPGELVPQLTLTKGEYYNLSRLQRDLNMLRDEYGSRGYILADVNAEPTFHEQPGLLDLIYSIDEGQQYRVGRVIVNIDGGQSQTRNNVVLNRLSIRPGDIVDVREIRRSERRLQQSQLFMVDPARGQSPHITVKPRDDDPRLAEEPSGARGATIRGQSPGVRHRHFARRPIADLNVFVPPLRASVDDSSEPEDTTADKGGQR
jgi:outer membrane protein insertion porin family